MKKIISLSLSTLLFTTVACAQAPVFTTVATSGKNVFAGVKMEKKGMEPETYLLEVSGEKLSSQKISLPTEIIHREVVALFSAENNMVVVMSQRTVEQGDKPLLHSYDPSKKEWKKLAEVDCVSFAKVKVEASSITMSCVETDKTGNEIETPKKVALSGIKLIPTSEVTLPFVKSEKETLKAELLGEAFEWKELKVGLDKKEKIFKP
jgi:hypothetical protein